MEVAMEGVGKGLGFFRDQQNLLWVVFILPFLFTPTRAVERVSRRGCGARSDGCVSVLQPQETRAPSSKPLISSGVFFQTASTPPAYPKISFISLFHSHVHSFSLCTYLPFLLNSLSSAINFRFYVFFNLMSTKNYLFFLITKSSKKINFR